MPVAPSRAIRRAVRHGGELPMPAALYGLGPWGVRFRHGQLVMVTGRPKSGKTSLLQWLVHQWADCRVLYNCWDMPPLTAVARQASVITGHDVAGIIDQLGNDGNGSAFYEEALDGSNVQFCFDRRPELAEIGQELDAWVELFDAFPDVIVCDNLLNIDGAEEDHRALKFILRELQTVAYDTHALVFALHHAKEGITDTSRPPSARDTVEKVNQIPDLVLSVANNGQGDFFVSPVMNRDGGMDPNAEHPVQLHCDLARMQFSRYSMKEWE